MNMLKILNSAYVVHIYISLFYADKPAYHMYTSDIDWCPKKMTTNLKKLMKGW